MHRACADVGTSIGYVDTPGVHVSETRLSDEEALAQFEQIVLSQQPATEPWQPVTDYSFAARQQIESRHPLLVVETFAPTRVADVGCGPAHFTRMLAAIGVHCNGIDVAIPGNQYGLYCETDSGWHGGQVTLSHGDITDTKVCRENPVHDLVICREVLEHLTVQQIRLAVANLCALSSKYVYVTTRFAKQPAHFLSIETADDLDPTHISMTNQFWLRHLFVLEGFKRRADLEEKMDWMKKGRCLVYERT